MTFLELAKARYSVRKFSDKPVEQEKIDLILEAARVAPTAKNNQSQHIYVLRSPEAIEKINGLTPCIYGASTVFMVGYDKDRDYKNRFRDYVHSGDTDAAIVTTHMMLEAWELGVGSCWVQNFDRVAVHDAFELPENIEIVNLLPVGYADMGPADRHTLSRELSEMVTVL